jgi:hypothetical protein
VIRGDDTGVGDVAFHDLGLRREELPGAGHGARDHPDPLTVGDERAHQVAAGKAGGAGDQSDGSEPLGHPISLLFKVARVERQRL